MSGEQARSEFGRFQRGVLVCPDPRLREPVQKALGAQMDLIDLSDLQGYADLATILAAGPELCLVDVGSHRIKGLEIVKLASEAGIAVIALHQSSQPDLILEALRAGAGEFLFDPINPQDLANAVARLARRPPAAIRTQRGKIWLVMPAKGVVMATFLSCHLAERLARRTALRVLLADFDPVQGSVGFLLKLTTQFSLVEALADPAHLERDLWKKLTTRHGATDVLLAPEKPQLDLFDPVGAGPVLEFLRRNYDVAIADSPGPVSRWQLQLARLCDELVLVTSNDVATVQATQRMLRLLEGEGVPRARIRLLLHVKRRESSLSHASIETALQRPIFHTLPGDGDEAQMASSEGKQLPAGSHLSKSIDAMCDLLLGSAPAEPKKGWGHSWPKVFLKKQPAG